jgi:lysozyme
MNKTLGIDCSRWQGLMNFGKAYVAGARFAFIRAGSCAAVSGTNYVDYQFQRNASTAPTYMPTGAYWFFRPNHSPAAQADYFWNLIKDKAFKLPPVIDVEAHASLDAATVAMRSGQFVNRMRQLSGKWCIVYTRSSFWNPYVGNPAWAKNCDLWAARYYAALDGPWSDGKYKPSSWDDWRFWQWSADGNNRGAEFGSTEHDMCIDYFNGGLTDLREYIGEPPPALTLEERVDRLEKAVFGLDIGAGLDDETVRKIIEEPYG